MVKKMRVIAKTSSLSVEEIELLMLADARCLVPHIVSSKKDEARSLLARRHI
jgi:hypothetical protein